MGEAEAAKNAEALAPSGLSASLESRSSYRVQLSDVVSEFVRSDASVLSFLDEGRACSDKRWEDMRKKMLTDKNRHAVFTAMKAIDPQFNYNFAACPLLPVIFGSQVHLALTYF